MAEAVAQRIWDTLEGFENENSARDLYCRILNYEYRDEVVPVSDWPESAQKLVVRTRVVAQRGTFVVIYVVVEKLARTVQRTVLHQILKHYPDCVVIFSDPGEEEFHITNARYDSQSTLPFVLRRIVVGATEKLRTASERLELTYAEDGDTATRLKAKHDDAFDVELVTKQFFKDYRKRLLDLGDHLYGQKKGTRQQAREFVLQFMNRLMFLYFIQKKGWLAGDHHFISSYLGKYSQEGNGDGFYQGWLEPLFFYSFNNKSLPASVKMPASIRKSLAKMPFLNGGLFERREELDELGFDIADEEIEKTIRGFLDRYNFTIREDTPLDVDVAVDPEMLGKVYEALVLEEEHKGRRKAGIFYTPRTEVDFMCRQSVLEHLRERTGLEYEKLVDFVYGGIGRESDEPEEISTKDANSVAEALLNAKIVDPACGSGAFLVGMLHTLATYYRKLGVKLKWKHMDEYSLRKQIVDRNLYGVDIKDWAVRVAELRLWLALIVEAEDELLARIEGPLLPNFDFKLRVGDSLVQEIGGEPIPLRFFRDLVTGKEDNLASIAKLKSDYYSGEAMIRIDNVKVMVVKAFVARIREEKKRLKRELRREAAVQQQITQTQVSLPLDEEKEVKRVEIEQRLEHLDHLEKGLWEGGIAKGSFYWVLDFPEVFSNGGFDIVIGNPPYVKYQEIGPADVPIEEQDKSTKKLYKESVARGIEAEWGCQFQRNMKSDYYIYFFYQGLALLRQGGFLCLVTSNSWLDVMFGFDFQRFLLRNSKLKAVYDNIARRTFEEAEVNTVITVIETPKDSDDIASSEVRFVSFKKPFEEVITAENLKQILTSSGIVSGPLYRSIPLLQMELWEKGSSSKGKQLLISDSDFEGEYVGGSWGSFYLRGPEILLRIIEEREEKLVRLGEVANVKTYLNTLGNDDFFFVTELSRSGGVSHIQSRIDGEEFEIESEYIVDFIESPKQLKSIVVGDGKETKLFRPPERGTARVGKLAKKYIAFGKRRGFGTTLPPQAYVKAPILLACYMSNNHAIYYNPKGVVSHRFFRISPKNPNDLSPKKLVLLMNSSLVSLFLEALRNPSLGAGVLAHGTYTIQQFRLPNPNEIDVEPSDFDEFLSRDIRSVFEECGIDEQKAIRDQLPNPPKARRLLDDKVFDVLGLSMEERNEVYWSICELFRSRLEKASSLRKENRS